MTTYCFMFSVLFSKALTAGLTAFVVWFILYVPYVVSRIGTETTLKSKLIACIFSNTAFAHGCRLIMEFENIKNGIHWSDLWEPAFVANDISLGIVICYMLGSSLFYLLITLFIDNKIQKCCIPFYKKCCSCCTDKNETKVDLASSDPNFESNTNCHASIIVKSLCKVYVKRKAAIDNLKMNTFPDEITIFFGTQLSGKTTTISLLAGIHSPTSGTALINQYDIRKNLRRARNSMSYCPQHNVVYEALTVFEHIEFFSRLKGLCKKDCKSEAMKYAEKLEMNTKIKQRAKYLTDEMKRKLSIAIALCSNSKVILLDEPTLGLDTMDRHAVWNLLQQEKKNRTILMTTRSMEETNIGDRIGILANGKLQCYGTPRFLKERIGSGYRLVCIKNNDCVPLIITEFLQQFIPDVYIHDDNSIELVYYLSHAYVDKFEQIFEILENKQQYFGIRSFSVFLTPMEVLFEKIASNSMAIAKNTSDTSNNTSANCSESNSENVSNTPSNTSSNNVSITSNHHRINISRDTPLPNIKYPDFSEITLVHGLRLYVNQWNAVFRKRYICWKRTADLYIIQITIPILFIIITALAYDTANVQFQREIALSQYGKTVTLLDIPTSFNDNTTEK